MVVFGKACMRPLSEQLLKQQLVLPGRVAQRPNDGPSGTIHSLWVWFAIINQQIRASRGTTNAGLNKLTSEGCLVQAWNE